MTQDGTAAKTCGAHLVQSVFDLSEGSADSRIWARTVLHRMQGLLC
jgi:hypothetical protein